MKPTESVYLNPVTTPRHEPAPRQGSRIRSLLAATCTTIGLVALALAVVVWGLRILVFDSKPVMDALAATLEDPSGRADLEQQIAAGIEHSLVGEQLTTVAGAFELDVAAEASRIAPAILDDPVVQQELEDIVADIHTRVLLRPRTGDLDLDLDPLTIAVRTVIDRESPRLAAIIPPDTTLWTVDPGSIPDLTGPANLLDHALPLTLVLALLVAVGTTLHPHRHRVAMWAGRASLGFGVGCALGAIGLPYLAGGLTGWTSVEIAVRSESLHLLAPAGLAGILGTGLVAFAAVARRRDERTVIEEGAAAALGYNEPPLWQHGSAPSLDLASRDLVDLNHPLTNT